MSIPDNYELDFGFGVGTYDLNANLTLPADGCTQCGMCLATCPTYKNSEELTQSPMGRIQIIRNINSGAYEYKLVDADSLDTCLACGTCETVCPSKVAYLDLLHGAKSKLREQRSKSLYTNTLLMVLKHTLLLSIFANLAKPFVPLAHFLRNRIKSEKLYSLLTGIAYSKYANETSNKSYYKSSVKQTALKISLFKGCVSSVFDRQVQDATMSLLRSCGVKVYVANDQTCCGAVHAHNGDKTTAINLAIKNMQALQSEPVDAIINTSSGCGLYLKEYGKLLDEETKCISEPAKAMSTKTTDILSWLYSSAVLNDFQFNSCNKVVALHTPCSLKTDELAISATKLLLNKIPGLVIHNVSDFASCCGAGGSHLLTHPQKAASLRVETLNDVKNINPDIVLTSNVSCSLHLKEGLMEQGLDIEVLHPVQLLERQLQEQRRSYDYIH